jgi:MoxR-like ATPase
LENTAIREPEIIKALNKIDKVKADLNTILIDREKIIVLSLLALIAQENILLLGPPGTAKSLLASEVCKRIKGAFYFQRLLTKFTTDSELFVSGQAISEEEVNDKKSQKPIKITRIRTYVEGMLPTCHIAFLDEIFKSNSAILNALLTLINERVYYSNDGKTISSNLISVFGASNERPRPEDGLDALYDRFLIRYYINYLKGDDFKKLLLLETDNKKTGSFITFSDLKILYSYLNEITIPEYIIDLIDRKKQLIKEEPELNMINPSDRRMKNSLKLLKAHALLYKRSQVTAFDINEVYPFILWDTSYGISSNLKYHTLQILIDYFTKDMNPDFKKFFEYSKEIETKQKEIMAIENEITNGIQNNNIQKAKEQINIYFEKGPKLTAEINGDLRQVEAGMNAAFSLNEKDWLKKFKGILLELKKDIDNKIDEYVVWMRNY